MISQNVDKENRNLKRQLTILQEEMIDATEKMNETVEELHSTQMKAMEYKGAHASNIPAAYTFKYMLSVACFQYKNNYFVLCRRQDSESGTGECSFDYTN